MSRYIRKFNGVPPISQFDFNEGTPLVIDTTTGVIYYVEDNTVFPVEPTPDRVRVAYGGIRVTAQRAITLNGTWTRIVNYDASVYGTPVNITESLTAGTLQIDRISTYRVAVTLAMSFTEINAGQSYFIRLVDAVSGAVLAGPIECYVGRNTAGSTPSFTFGAVTAVTGRKFAIEIGGGDTFAAVQLKKAEFSVHSIG